VDAPTAEADRRLEIDVQADADLYALYQQSLYDVAKGSVQRAQSAAEVVQRAAAAVGTIYAATLGLSFSAADRPLPTHALVPALYFGIAVASSTVYLAFVSRGGDVAEEASSTVTRVGARRRFRFFVGWTDAVVQRRVAWLRAGVLALSVGVAALPMPFIQFSDPAPTTGSAIDWPEQPSGGDPALNAILYRAEVAEVAAQRMETARPSSDDDAHVWWLLGALGLVVIVAGAALGGIKKAPR
jgi:hypothetical protein